MVLMANTIEFLTPSVPKSRGRSVQASIPISLSGFFSFEGISKKVFCFSASAGAEPERHASSAVSPIDSAKHKIVSTKGCKFVGCGSAVPTLQISNDDLSKIVDTSDEWIYARTGIRNRRVLSGRDSFTSLAAEAASNALKMAKVDPDEVDLLLMCTSIPENLLGCAPQIQKQLGCKRTPLAYDITAACSAFLLGLISAACHIRAGGFRNVLVIGADAITRYVDWTDKKSCILFGDAAGAVLVQACNSEEDGLFGFDLHSDSSGQRHLKVVVKENEKDNATLNSDGVVNDFPPRQPSYSCIQMNGQEVFRFAIQCVPQSIASALENAGLPVSSIDWLLLHQANKRIIDAVATQLEVPSERVISNLANNGNTGAASIPLALDEAVTSGKVKAGQTIAIGAYGAGLTWGSAIVRWG